MFSELAIDSRAYGTDPDRQVKAACDVAIAYINALCKIAAISTCQGNQMEGEPIEH